MNLTWLRHLVFSLVTTLICLSACFAVILVLQLKFPVGLDDAIALVGICFAALLSVFLFMPLNIWHEITADSSAVHNRPILFWIFCSMLLATAGSLGGGILRRWLTGEATVLEQPLSNWWYAVAVGWAGAFFLSLIGLNLYKRFAVPAKAMDELDAWVMGVFAASGAFAALSWQPFGIYSDQALIRIVQAAVFAGLTGAGGGLVARLVNLLTLNFEPRQILPQVWDWFLRLYLSLAVACGTTALLVLIFIQALLSPRKLNYTEFAEKSIGGSMLFNPVSYSDGTILGLCKELFLYTDFGNRLGLSIITGGATVYVFRLAAPYFIAEKERIAKNS